jgi:aminopeptidase N
MLITWAVIGSGQKPMLGIGGQTSQTEAQVFAKSVSFIESDHYADFDIVYQRMEWDINPAVKFISGSVTSYFVSKTESFDSVFFDLEPSLLVKSVKSRDQDLGFKHESDKLAIKLKNPLSLNSLDSLTISYEGVPDASGFGSFVQANHNDVPVIWTLSEPYGAKDWWPCKQSLADKIDSIDIRVKCPENYTCASNGVLMSDEVENGFRTIWWKHRYPIATYLVAIGITNYTHYTDSLEIEPGKILPIENYVYPENLENARQGTRQNMEVLALYNQLFGTYPFAGEKFGHAQFSWGGGMEHQTISFVSSFDFDLLAHELAHQWFGDYITLASWHDIWLNEGFATFATGLAYQNLLNGEWWPVWKKVVIDYVTSVPDGSVYVADTTDINRVFSSRLSYHKGAALLHMLRWILGDNQFFTAVRNYLADPDVAYGFATQEKLVQHLEQACDTSLTKFFNDWYYGEGYPVYSATFSQNDTGILDITLSQQPSHPSVDFFEMPVPVRVYNADLTDSADFRLENLFNGQEFFADPGFRVSSIKIDPDLWLVAKTGTVSSVPWATVVSDILVYPNPVNDRLYFTKPYDEKITEIEILATDGRKIKSFAANQNTVDLSGIPGGSYLILFRSSTSATVRKIIKR